jgi:hypothetical protein
LSGASVVQFGKFSAPVIARKLLRDHLQSMFASKKHLDTYEQVQVIKNQKFNESIDDIVLNTLFKIIVSVEQPVIFTNQLWKTSFILYFYSKLVKTESVKVIQPVN